MSSGGENLEPSPPPTPPGFTKYYCHGSPPPKEWDQKGMLMVDQEEEDEDEHVVILQGQDYSYPPPPPHLPSDEGRKFFSITIKRGMSRFLGMFIALLSLLFLITFLVEYDRSTRENGKFWGKNNKSLGGILFGSFMGASRMEKFYWTSSPAHNNQFPSSLINKSKRLPQCIIIGARKCGTRALIDMLNLHPQVEKAALEVHFFDRDENYGQGLEWYRSHMPETREDQICLEKSPSYFVTPEVPERIHGMNSSVKLLLIVREPVTRVISDYTQIYGTNPKSHNGTSKSPRLEEMVLLPDGSVNVHYKAIRISMYARYLQRWLDLFPLHQIHTIDGDALIRDPFPVVKDVERFLGLSPRLSRDNFYFNVTKGFYCWRKLENLTSSIPEYSSTGQVPDAAKNESLSSSSSAGSSSTGLHCLNDSKGRPHPQVDMRIVSKLRRFYNPHNLRFYDMVSRDFGWPEQ